MRSFKTKFLALFVLITAGLLVTVSQATAYTIEGFGRLEALYSGFFQVFLPIGIIVTVAFLVYKIFLPGAQKFLGGLFG